MDKFGDDELKRLRSIPCVQIFTLLCDHTKKDREFIPLKSVHSERWHVHAGGHDFEILVTGPKFFDTHAGKGGGGAIDLTMHLLGLSFKRALRKLHDLNVLNGG